MTVAKTEGKKFNKYFAPQVPDVTMMLLISLKLTLTMHFLLMYIMHI
jgi:hypothetical protein